MNLKQLETFLWITRLGSFSAAARRLNATQPSVSMRVRQLESDLGVDLFEEPRRATRLTPQGRELVVYAERILSLASEAATRLGEPTAVAGRIRIGVGETIALAWLPDFIARLNMTFPRLIIESEVDLTTGLWAKFHAGELELLMLPGPARGSNLIVDDLGSTSYAWMASPKLALSNNGPLTPRDLQPWPIITLSQDSILHQITENWFRSHDAEPKRMDICNSLGVVAALTRSGLGISMLPLEIYHNDLERGDLVVLDTEPRLPSIEFISVYRKDREPGFIGAIAEIAKQTNTFGHTTMGAATS